MGCINEDENPNVDSFTVECSEGNDMKPFNLKVIKKEELFACSSVDGNKAVFTNGKGDEREILFNSEAKSFVSIGDVMMIEYV